jgi:hypothetical protein
VIEMECFGCTIVEFRKNFVPSKNRLAPEQSLGIEWTEYLWGSS